MRGRLFATIIFSCLLALFVGSISALTAGAPDQPTENLRYMENLISCCVKVSSFQVTQSVEERRKNAVSVAIDFGDERENSELRAALVDGTSRLILLKTNGQQLLSVPVKLDEPGVACNTDPDHLLTVYLYSLKMSSIAAQAHVSKGEPIQGVLYVRVYNHEYSIPLPETLADVAD